MQKVLLFDRTDAGVSADFLGHYSGAIGGEPYLLELALDAQKAIAGSFKANGETLQVYAATLSNTGALYGLLLEPSQGLTMAIFRATLADDELVLELDVPDPDERLDFSGAERVRLQRFAPQLSQNQDPLPGGKS